MSDALSQAESYQYDAAGNLAFVTDRKGQVRGFTYDKLGRKTEAGFGATSTTSPVYDSTIAYTYDTANRVTQMVDSANGTITRQYDDRFDTITQETTPQGTVSYVYDAAGRRSSMTPANGGTQVSYTYDAANRLTQITQGSSTVQFSYDAANRRSVLTLANGVTLTYGYDVGNELTSITYRDAANTLLGDLTYTYDNAGRRTGMGGSFARTNLPSAIASATYDVNNRVTNWDGAILSHDANGNLLGFAGDTYTWNKRDQLSGISGTSSASFQYDAVGRRQAKTISGAATQFLYDGLNPIQELSGASVAASLLTGLGVDEFFARTEGSSTQHYLTDALGSTLRLTNNSAGKIVDYTYEPYGKASADASSTNAFQYTGRENDGTGLNYYRARYQDPVLGRFVSEDPIGLLGGPHLYVYARSNPLSYTDATGLINFVGGVGGSLVPGYGFEGSVARIYNPGWFGQESGDVLALSLGQGVGLNLSGDAFVGFIKEGMNNIEGDTTNINVVAGPLSITIMFDRKTNDFIGFTAGIGPSATFIGGSVTNSSTKIILGSPKRGPEPLALLCTR